MTVNTCKRGHEQTPENVYTSPKGVDQCSICRAMLTKRFKAGLTGFTKAEREPKKSNGSGQIAPRTYLQQMAREAMKGKI